MHTDHFRVRPGDRRALRRCSPGDTGSFDGKQAAIEHLQKGLRRLTDLQERLYAQDRYALLLVFQGMDGAGKDSAIKHVMTGVNPAGVDVHGFTQPSSEETDHDFLWRAAKALPARGRIGLFNRSYYEDVIVVRVHPELLARQQMPRRLVTSRIWEERFEDIVAFERHLARNGTVVRKFFLHLSKKEQARRMLDRLDDRAKNWKYSGGDLVERRRWKPYHEAYRDAMAATSTRESPWYVVPADHKWFAHAVIADVIVEALEHLDLGYPKLTPEQTQGLKRVRRTLERDA